MAMRSLKQLALKWRLEEQMSYSQIKQRVKVSKSTLSLWLRNYPLSEERIRALRDNSEIRIEHYRETRRRTREERFERYKQEEKIKLGPLSDRDLMMIGLALYWGEGGKTSRGMLSVSNTDPGVIKMSIAWLTRVVGVSRNALKIRLQLYKDMDLARETSYWSETLNLPIENFSKPSIKPTYAKHLNNKGLFGHGTCEVAVFKTELKERIMANLQLLSAYFD